MELEPFLDFGKIRVFDTSSDELKINTGSVYSLRRSKFKPQEINGEIIYNGYLLKRIEENLPYPEIDAALLQESLEYKNDLFFYF